MKFFINLLFSKTAQDTSVLMVGNLLASGMGVVFTLLTARILGPESWAIVSAVLSFIAITVAIGDLGLGASLFRFVSRHWHNREFDEANRLLKFIFSLRVLSGLLLLIVLLVFSPVLSPLFFKVNEPMLVIFAGLSIFFLLLIDFQVLTFESKRKWKTASFFIALTNVLRVILILLLMFTHMLNILTVVFVLSASAMISLLVSFVKQRIVFGFSVNWLQTAKEIFAFSGWLGVNKIVGSASSRIDVLILLQMTSAFETGIFSAAKQLAMGIPPILGSFATVLAPRFATLERSKLYLYFKKTMLLSLAITIMILLGVVFSPMVVLLFGSKFIGSTPVLQWYLVSIIPQALSVPAVNILIYGFNKPQVIAVLTIFQLLAVIMGNIVLIPIFRIYAPILIYGVWNMVVLVVTYSLSFYELKTRKII